MALRSLSTNLRSLKYGKDQPGGGNSQQPYIVTTLPQGFDDPFSTFSQVKISAAGLSPDFLIRGSALSIFEAADDARRIGKFLIDPSKGPQFIIKQVGLQLSNPKIETGKSIGIENTRLYNLGINTLAQVPLTPVGIHLDRAGLLFNISDQNKYLNIVDQKNKNTPNKNRLVELYSDKILIDSEDNILNQKIEERISRLKTRVDKFKSSRIGSFVNRVAGNSIDNFIVRQSNKIKKALNPSYYIIDEYNGGPGSVYGLGKTTINRYYFSENPRTENYVQVEGNLGINYLNVVGAPSYFVQQYQFNGIDVNPNITPSFVLQTQGVDKTEEINNSFQYPSTNDSHLNSISFNYNMLIEQKIADSSENFVGLIGPDFRKKINDVGERTNGGLPVLPYNNYKKYNMMSRIGIGDQGKPGFDRIKVDNIGDGSTQDKISMLPLFKEEIQANEGGTVNINGKEHSTRDLIKFRFEAVDNDNPSKTIKIIFRAFIDNFGDSYTADWAATKYVGRGENFYNYNGFNRQINLGFKIVAQSRAEMKPLYQKLNYLISNTAPDYQQNGFMRGPFTLFTLGNWVYKQPTIINSLNISIKDSYSWEIAMNRPENEEDKTMSELPQILDITMGITPIHNFIPRKGPTVPFINTGTTSQNNWLKSEEFSNL